MKAIIIVTTFLAVFLGWFGIGYKGPDQEKYRKNENHVAETVSYIDSVQSETEQALIDLEQQIKSDRQDVRYISVKAQMIKNNLEIR